MARKAAAVVKEGTLEPVPESIITGDIEIEVGDLEAVPPSPESVEVETTPEPAPAVTDPGHPQSITPAPSPVEPEKPPEDSALQRRLRETEEAARLANEREQAALEQARQSQARERQAIERDRRSQYDNVVNGLAAIEANLESLRQQNIDAGNQQDFARQAEIMEQLGAYGSKKEALENRRAVMDQQLEQWKRQPQQPQPQPQAQKPQPASQADVDKAISGSGLPERAQIWLRGHREYMTDKRLNDAMQFAHGIAERQAGTAFTDAYFDRMEVLLGLRDDAAPKAPASVPTQPYSAPASREAPSMSTGRPAESSTKITLSREEQEVAWSNRPRDNMTRQEANAVYAKNKIEMKKARANGSIS